MLAASLSLLAGYVDAIGFLRFGGLFVSFMSGNSTRLAVGLAGGPGAVAMTAAVIVAFVGGVIAGTVIGEMAGRRRAAVLLLVVAILLAVAGVADAGRASHLLVAVVLAAAMGAENTVFQRDGEVSIGVTYMTGTLVKLGQRIAAALRGGARWAWLPYLLLWSGLIVGAMAGAGAYARFGMTSVWAAALLAVVLTGATWRRPADVSRG